MDSLETKPLTIDSINSGVSLVEAKKSPDLKDRLEDEEAIAAALRNELARSRIKNVKADRKMRKQYASRILRYLELYSSAVFILLLIHGFKISGFSLEDEILAALVGSTAIAAIGLVGFIARGLFKSPDPVKPKFKK